MKVLHIIATPRNNQSNTLRVSQAFLEVLSAHHENLTVEIVDLFDYDLPAVAGRNVEAKYSLMAGRP